MSWETIGINRNPPKEYPSQISAQSIEPSFKLPIKESVPLNVGRTVKNFGKIVKNSAIAFFSEEWNGPKVS